VEEVNELLVGMMGRSLHSHAAVETARESKNVRAGQWQ
jgi:hypothetical protein